mmetsp:Transcript_173183/g.555394  ORF Transcript_173183/g.555394 Transcript_173183/m.555394 type:complete len:427 (+) Transcript_173183:126-1406(+)
MVDLSVDYSKQCKNCMGKHLVIVDTSSGDQVCTGCGLVLAEKLFDTGTEWRTFKDEGVGDGKQVNARERGDSMSAYNELLGEEFKAGTDIYGTGSMAEGLKRAIQSVDSWADMHSAKRSATAHSTSAPKLRSMQSGRASSSSAGAPGGLAIGDAASAAAAAACATGDGFDERQMDKLIQAQTNKCRIIISRMNLGDNVTQRCMSFLQQLAKRGELRPGSQRPWHCALVHLACREERCPQTIYEIAQASAPTDKKMVAVLQGQGGRPVKKESVEKAGGSSAASEKLEKAMEPIVKDLSNLLGLAKQKIIVEDADLMKRMVQQLELAPQVATPASEIVKKAFKQNASLGLKINNLKPNALMAAAIFVVAWLLDVERKPTLEQVAALARSPAGNVKAAYKVLHPKLRYLVPGDLKIRLPGSVGGLPEPQ